MPRIFYDSVTATDIPVAINGVPIDGVLGYVDGDYVWSPADWARFSEETVRVTIAVFPSSVADVLDVESGNPSTPSDAVAWVERMRTAGNHRPTIYCSANGTYTAIVDAFNAANVPLPDFDLANWTGQPHQIDDAPIVQFASPETSSGGHYDLNVVWDDTWHPAPVVVPPAPRPVPVPVPVPPPVAPPAPVDPVEVAAMSFPVLSTGATGTAVRKAQGLLNAFGYGLVEDGVYGPKTEGACLGFQRNHPPLAVDGSFGPKTCASALSA